MNSGSHTRFMVLFLSMRSKLTPKQKKFADTYLEVRNASEAVRQSYAPTTPTTVRNIASENLAKPNIIEYLEGKAALASSRIVELALQDDHLPTALQASKDILDRAGYSAVDKTLSLTMNVNTDELKSMIVNDITRFRGKGKGDSV